MPSSSQSAGPAPTRARASPNSPRIASSTASELRIEAVSSRSPSLSRRNAAPVSIAASTGVGPSWIACISDRRDAGRLASVSRAPGMLERVLERGRARRPSGRR